MHTRWFRGRVLDRTGFIIKMLPEWRRLSPAPRRQLLQTLHRRRTVSGCWSAPISSEPILTVVVAVAALARQRFLPRARRHTVDLGNVRICIDDFDRLVVADFGEVDRGGGVGEVGSRSLKAPLAARMMPANAVRSMSAATSPCPRLQPVPVLGDQIVRVHLSSSSNRR